MRKGVLIKLLLVLLLAGSALLVVIPKETLATISLGDSWFAKYPFRLGLDLQGGTQLRYRIDLTGLPEADHGAVTEGIRQVMEKRVNGLGVSEAVIQTSQLGDQNYMIVELPGIKDMQQAIKAVGKTVQLEFKELRDEYTEAELAGIRERNTEKERLAREALQKALQGEDFAALVSAYGDAGNVAQGGEMGDMARAQLDPAVADIAFALSDGAVSDQLIQTETSYIIVKTIAHGEREQTVATDEKATARHILISHAGAGTEATRTEDEARTLADEILQKVRNGEDFATLAQQYSDDAGSKATGGYLDEFGRGAMVPEFDQAVFGAAAGDVVGPVETTFGFHIIRVETITGRSETVETEPVVNTAQIILTREPEKPLDGWAPTGLTGKHFTHASAQMDQTTLTYMVAVVFNEEGKQMFADLTKRNLGKPVAIFLDNELISAPTVQQEIADGQAVISGSFTAEETTQLARDLNTGAIPAPVILNSQTTVDATLGADALDTGVRAGIVGTIALMLFMIAYYRLPGLVACIALAIYAVFVMAVFKLWPITLTLAGIAGFILSVGMAVDANVLIFERFREELRAGKSINTAIEEGFRRAWSAIRDSNMSSLITCMILWMFGTSIIRGFAITLSIGILLSMFTAITITRTLLHVFVRPSLKSSAALWGVPITEDQKH